MANIKCTQCKSEISDDPENFDLDIEHFGSADKNKIVVTAICPECEAEYYAYLSMNDMVLDGQ